MYFTYFNIKMSQIRTNDLESVYLQKFLQKNHHFFEKSSTREDGVRALSNKNIRGAEYSRL